MGGGTRNPEELTAIVKDLVYVANDSVDISKITNQSRFIDDLGFDSMMSMELAQLIEEEFDIIVKESKYSLIETFGDLVDFVKIQLGVVDNSFVNLKYLKINYDNYEAITKYSNDYQFIIDDDLKREENSITTYQILTIVPSATLKKVQLGLYVSVSGILKTGGFDPYIPHMLWSVYVTVNNVEYKQQMYFRVVDYQGIDSIMLESTSPLNYTGSISQMTLTIQKITLIDNVDNFSSTDIDNGYDIIHNGVKKYEYSNYPKNIYGVTINFDTSTVRQVTLDSTTGNYKGIYYNSPSTFEGIYENDVIVISATPKIGYKIVSGTGSYTITSNTDITVTAVEQ